MANGKIIERQRLIETKVQGNMKSKLIQYINAIQRLSKMIQQLSRLWKMIVELMSRNGHFDYDFDFRNNPPGSYIEPTVNREKGVEDRRTPLFQKLTVMQQKMLLMNNSIYKGGNRSIINGSAVNRKILNILTHKENWIVQPVRMSEKDAGLYPKKVWMNDYTGKGENQPEFNNGLPMNLKILNIAMNKKNRMAVQWIRLIDKFSVLYSKMGSMNNGTFKDGVLQSGQIQNPRQEFNAYLFQPAISDQSGDVGKPVDSINIPLQSRLEQWVPKNRVHENPVIQGLIRQSIFMKPESAQVQSKLSQIIPAHVFEGLKSLPCFTGTEGNKFEIQAGPNFTYGWIQSLLQETGYGSMRKPAQYSLQAGVEKYNEAEDVSAKRAGGSSFNDFEQKFSTFMDRRRRLSFIGG
jgi:hypothetical protein